MNSLEKLKQSFLQVKANRLYQNLYKVLDIPIEQRHEFLTQAYHQYKTFCEQNNIQMEPLTNQLINASYIIESTPVMKDIPVQDLSDIKNKLENQAVLTMEEANLLLEWTVQNTRKFLSIDKDVLHESLQGCCGISQSASLFPLEDLGLQTTVNQIGILPHCEQRHAFGTVFIPIIQNGNIVRKQFLIDVTYRQFFSSIFCNVDNYSDNSMPWAGYFITQSPKGKEVATQILKHGFILLDEDVALEYVKGFMMDKVKLGDTESIEKINQVTGTEALSYLSTYTEEYDYDKEELEQYGFVNELNPKEKTI